MSTAGHPETYAPAGPAGEPCPAGAERQITAQGGNTVDDQQKQDALAQATDLLGDSSAAVRQTLSQLWDIAFEQGKLAALDELQDRFCVCMK